MERLPFDNVEAPADGHLPAEWKWRCLLASPAELPAQLAARWASWSAEARHAEDLAVLRFWAHRGDRAA